MKPRKRRPRSHVIAEMGVNFLERQVLRRGHQLRRVPQLMSPSFTNRTLQQLLVELGFDSADVVENHRVWRHPQSGCTLLLPVNKLDESPRPADVVGVRAHLDLQGHLDEADFDYFVAHGKLPQAASRQ